MVSLLIYFIFKNKTNNKRNFFQAIAKRTVRVYCVRENDSSEDDDDDKQRCLVTLETLTEVCVRCLRPRGSLT